MSLILSGSDGVSDIDGTVSTPAIRGTDSNTGIFFPAADTIAFAEGGAESIRITSAGRLGIGTTSPAELLDSRGAAVFSGDNATGTNAFGTASGILLSTASDNSVARITAISNGNNSVGLSLRSLSSGSAVEGIRIDSSGNVGIGTSSPSGKRLYVLGGGAIIDQVSAGGSTLTVNRTSNPGSVAFQYDGTETGQISAVSGGGLIFYTGSTPTERMRIDSSGNLLVGTTSPLLTSARRGISVLAPTGNFVAGSFANDAGANAQTMDLWNKATSGNNAFMSFFTEGGSGQERGNITYNRAGGLVAYNTTSDYRAKDIISPVLNSGEVIDSVPVYMGKMKGATQARPMFIAHETPEYAHTGEKDAVDKDGKPVYQQMDASSLVPVLWAEIQSLRKRVATLESK